MNLWTMSDKEIGRSSELEELRLMLFPHLTPEEGRQRIDAALEGAADDERLRRIEELAADPDLDAELLRRVLQIREDGSA
jgi:hypothetical protein